MMTRRILISIFILAAGLILCPAFVYAQTDLGGNKEEIEELNKQIQDRKDKIKELEESIAKYQKNIDQKRTEAVSLKNQLSILDNRLAQTETDIALTQEKIKEAELEINALNLSIKEKESTLTKQKKIVAEIVRNIHAEDQKNYLEILLTNESFADFYNQVQYLESVYTDLGHSVKLVRLAKEELDAKKAQVDARRLVYEDLKQTLDNKRKDLVEQSGVKSRLLADTHSSEMRYRTLLETQRAQYQAIEGELRSYEDQVRKKLAEQEKFNNLDSGEFTWPVPSRYITCLFHDPDYPFRNVFEHSGIDIRASQGTAVKATAAGYVARAKRCTSASCYSYILIVHSGNLSSVYGHMSSIAVSEDDFVGKGDIIGYSGGTPGTVGAGPFVTGPHLHFEIRSNGIPVNPMGYLVN